MELAKGAYPKNPTILPFDQDSTVPVDPQRQIWQFFRFSSDFSCAHGHLSLALHLGKNLHISSSSVRGCKLVLWNYPQSGDGKDNHLRSSPHNLRKHRSRHNTRLHKVQSEFQECFCVFCVRPGGLESKACHIWRLFF